MAKKINSVIFIILLILVIFTIYYFRPKQNPIDSALKITIDEAKARRFGLIIDVRTPKERQLLGYYPNSIPISINNLQDQVPIDISSKNTWILVYSNGDNRASIAASILYKMGYHNVRYINTTYLSLMPGV